MARPNVQIKVIDESLVAPIGETESPGIGAMVSIQNLIGELGVTGEKQSGLMLVETINDWYGKLRTHTENYLKGLSASYWTGLTLQGAIGVCAASYVDVSSGATGWKPWAYEWWGVHNFLQYGGRCYIGGTGTDAGYSVRTNSLSASSLVFDVIFQGATSGATADSDPYATDVKTVVEAKKNSDFPVLGVVHAGEVTATAKINSTSDEYYVNVAGHKYHLNPTGQGLLDSSKLIMTNLAPDVAGCITRTDRDSFPWFSPAGRVRGRILNVVRLLNNPTVSQQDTLYDAGINPVVTFPGEGTVLFGDKTGAADTSTLSRINVSRLFIYLRKIISPIARSILFEINDETTRANFRIAAFGVLDRIRGQRGITDFRIICDETNNPPELVQARLFQADILVKPTIAINYVRITFTNKNLYDNLDQA